MATLTSTGIKFSSTDQITTKRWMFQGPPTAPDTTPATTWIFYQASSPTGWTQVSQNNKALRVVSGAGGGSGGSISFTSTMAAQTYSGICTSTTSTGGHPLSSPQIPSHFHPMDSSNYALSAVPAVYNPDGSFAYWNGGDVRRSAGFVRNSPATGDQGSGDSHAHPLNVTGPISQPFSLAVQYIDVIVCSFSG